MNLCCSRRISLFQTLQFAFASGFFDSPASPSDSRDISPTSSDFSQQSANFSPGLRYFSNDYHENPLWVEVVRWFATDFAHSQQRLKPAKIALDLPPHAPAEPQLDPLRPRALFASHLAAMALNADAMSLSTSDADTAALKRKREDSTTTHQTQPDSSATRSKQTQTDLLQVLEQYALHKRVDNPTKLTLHQP